MVVHKIAFNGGPAHGTVDVVIGEPEQTKYIETPLRVSPFDFNADEPKRRHVYELRRVSLKGGNDAFIYVYAPESGPDDPMETLLACGAIG